MSKVYKKNAKMALVLIILFIFWKAMYLSEETVDKVRLKPNVTSDSNSTGVYNKDPYLFTYSAYEDDRLSPYPNTTQVRVLTFLHVKDTRSYACYFLHQNRVVLIVDAKMHFIVIKFHPNMRHNTKKFMLAAELICDIPKAVLHDQGKVEVTLLLAGHHSDKPAILQGAVEIQRASPPNKPMKRKFTVCICPIFGKVRAADFIEMMEVNMYFGADYFVIYNNSIPVGLNKIIEVYRKAGLLEVVQFGLREPVLTHSHYYGQELVVNDCLYRQMASSQYMVFTDLDEFIAPLSHGTWKPMMESLHDHRYGSYMFLHAYFMLKQTRDSNEMKIANIERYVQKTLRPETRSKVIVAPQNMRYMGIHRPFLSMPGKKNRVVPSNVGQLNHFKRFQVTNEKFTYKPNLFWKNVLDKTVNQFKMRLKQA